MIASYRNRSRVRYNLRDKQSPIIALYLPTVDNKEDDY